MIPRFFPVHLPVLLELWKWKKKGCDGFLRSFYAVFRFPRGVNRLHASLFVKMDFEQDGCSSFIYLKIDGLRGHEKGTTANSRSNWFRFQRSSPVSTPDAKADDCTGDWIWAGMTTKQRKTAMFWNSHKNTHLFAPNIRHTLDNFPNFSVIYLITKTCQISFFWRCFDIFLLF